MTSSSMLVSLGRSGASTHVRMRLDLGGRMFDIAQLGPNFILLKSPAEHPSTEGTLIVAVDDDEYRWPVRLPEGMSATSRRAAIEKL